MDTLPLNGNHGNSYSIASAEYMSDCVQIIDRGYNHKETTLEKKILKELTSNYIPSYLNNSHERSSEQNRNLMNKLVNNVSNGGKDGGYGMGLGVGMGMNSAPPPLPLPESFFPLLTNEHTEDEGSSPSHSHQRDSLYTSMPMLPGLPDVSGESADGSKEGGDAKSPEASSDDVYYKSMPNLGSRNHLHQLHSYYQLGRGSSDGFIVPPNREDLSPEEAQQEPSHLVTSL
uniref:GPCR family 2 latrophilin C-terminal domain-containing protein n=1 Tax=Haplochromis burtoni TaxID=8153 RepID=A0A3Q2WQX5_HAPBU